MKLIRMRRINLVYVFLIIAFLGCERSFIPKPKGYNRIDLPEHKYVKLHDKHPYEFEYSAHAKVEPHQSSLTEPHWIDIKYPELNASIELTYKSLENSANKLDQLIVDAHKLKSKHNIKAYAVDEALILTPEGYRAVIFELEGEVPSQFQFYLTDSTQNFMRGALYFPIATKNDSLAPVIEFVKEDMMHMLNTFKWKELQ